MPLERISYNNLRATVQNEDLTFGLKSIALEPSNMSVVSDFVLPGSDFHLDATSLLVDAGDPTVTIDAFVDGPIDIGAYEFDRVAPLMSEALPPQYVVDVADGFTAIFRLDDKSGIVDATSIYATVNGQSAIAAGVAVAPFEAEILPSFSGQEVRIKMPNFGFESLVAVDLSFRDM